MVIPSSVAAREWGGVDESGCRRIGRPGGHTTQIPGMDTRTALGDPPRHSPTTGLDLSDLASFFSVPAALIDLASVDRHESASARRNRGAAAREAASRRSGKRALTRVPNPGERDVTHQAAKEVVSDRTRGPAGDRAKRVPAVDRRAGPVDVGVRRQGPLGLDGIRVVATVAVAGTPYRSRGRCRTACWDTTNLRRSRDARSPALDDREPARPAALVR